MFLPSTKISAPLGRLERKRFPTDAGAGAGATAGIAGKEVSSVWLCGADAGGVAAAADLASAIGCCGCVTGAGVGVATGVGAGVGVVTGAGAGVAAGAAGAGFGVAAACG